MSRVTILCRNTIPAPHVRPVSQVLNLSVGDGSLVTGHILNRLTQTLEGDTATAWRLGVSLALSHTAFIMTGDQTFTSSQHKADNEDITPL